MGHSLRWSVVVWVVSCHSGGAFDLSGVPEDPGTAALDPVPIEPMMSMPALLPVGDAGVSERDSGTGSELVSASPAPILSSAPATESELAPLGATCSADGECSSAHCSTGRCCNGICDDCEVCSSEGRCEPQAMCNSTSCDAGQCRAAGAPLGATCSDGGECDSGFCADGVCCDSACEGVCRQCSAEGRCDVVPASDPNCTEVVCFPDTACRLYRGFEQRVCAGLGRCAGAEDCLAVNVAMGMACDDVGSRCDGQGSCQRDLPIPPFEPTQVCPGLEGGPLEFRVDAVAGQGGCWAGKTYDVAAQYSFGSSALGYRGPGTLTLGAFVFGFATSAKTQAFDAAGVLIPGCVVVDPVADASWEYATFSGDTCRNAAFVRFTAHMSETGDL